MKRGVEDWMFWSEIGSGFGELGSKPQRRIPQGLAPPQGRGRVRVRGARAIQAGGCKI